MKKRPEITQSLYAQFFDFKPRKGDLRKIRLIEATVDCIASDGIEQTTFESIGKRLKIGRAHVAYYYPNRLDLIEAAIKFAVSTVQTFTVENVKAASDDKERLRGYINGTFEWLHTFPKHASVVLLLYYYASFDKRFRKLHHEVRSLGAERIAAILKPLVSSRHQGEVETLAKWVQSVMTGHLVDYMTTSPVRDLESLRLQTMKEIEGKIKSYT